MKVFDIFFPFFEYCFEMEISKKFLPMCRWQNWGYKYLTKKDL